MLPYALRQLLWLLGITLRLVLAMSAGLKWVFQMLRLYLYALCVAVLLLPSVFWYLTSPHIIRHVAYRSSEATKRRNVLRILEEEGLEWGAVGAEAGGQPRGGPNVRAVRRLAGGGISINPADGTALQGLPLPRESGGGNSGNSNSGGGGGGQRQRQGSRRPRTSPAKQEAEKRSSSSSCDITVERRCSSGGEDYTNTCHNDPEEPVASDRLSSSSARARPMPRRRPPSQRGPPPPPRAAPRDARPVRPLPPTYMRPRRAAEARAVRAPPPTDHEDEEDRMNLHNRAFLDIYLPVPLDSLMNTLEFAKRNSKLRRKKFPIVILLCGGIWIIGSNLWGALLARLLAARGYVVFCPDYRNFPQATMEGMTLDVSDAISWVLNNAERYNGDLDSVTLIGHDSGAHLTMMSLISQAQMCAYEESKQREGPLWDCPFAPSEVAYNVPRFDPRRSIHRYIGLSGMYNVEGLAAHFARKGLSRRVLTKIAGGRDQITRYSLPAYFDSSRIGETGEVLPENLFDFLPRKMFFLHGDADRSAPVSESATLVGTLRAAQQERKVRQQQRQRAHQQHTLQREELLRSASREEMPSLAVTWAAEQEPKPAVELEFIVVQGARHGDMTIEECVAAGRSCCVEFLCDYESTGDLQSITTPSDSHGSTFPAPSGRGPAGGTSGWEGAGGDSGYPSVPPGAFLPLAVPLSDRPLLLRIAAYFTPF